MRIAILLHKSIINDYRVLKTVETLSREHEIDVYYIKKQSNLAQTTSNNVRFIPIEHKNNLKIRLLRHSLFCYEFDYMYRYIIAQNTKYDIVWANDLPTLVTGHLLAKKIRAKLFYDAHEIYTETLNQFFPRDKKGLKNIIFATLIAIMRWHGKHVEKRILPQVNLFITVNESLLRFFNKRYTIKSSLVLMNLPRLADSIDLEKIDYRKRFNWSESSKIIIYQGALNEGRGLHLIIKTMNELSEKFKLVILGDGTLKKKLTKLAQELNVTDRVVFFGNIELRKLPSYTKGADIGINLLESFNLSKELASPNKLFEYIHAGIPVVASKTAENIKVVEINKIGLCCDNSVEDIRNTILEVIDNDYDNALREAKKRYNWEQEESSLLKATYD